MTRAELGERLGVTAGIVASWEAGRGKPSVEKWRSLAGWFAEEPPSWARSTTDILNLGSLVKERRQVWEMTQAELGKRLNVSVAAIGLCERGNTPSLHNMKMLFEWLAEKPHARRSKQSINTEFRKRIQKKRLMIGMSQTALSKHLSVDKKQIRHWENGLSSPSKRHAAMLETWLSEPADGILAQRLREKRAETHLTQKQLAAVLEVSLTTVKAWENGRASPSSEHSPRLISWLSRGHILRRDPVDQPEFGLFILPMKERRERLGIGTMTLALHLGVGKNRVREWESGRSVPSEAACSKISRWLEAA